MIKNKAGVSHLEAIISILIFISFVFALFYIIKPFETPTDNNNADILLAKLPKYLEANITSIGLLSEKQGSCFYINSPQGGRVMVYDRDGRIVDSRIVLTNLYIMGGNGFYTVYFWEDFEEGSMSVTSCNEAKTEDYKLSVRSRVEALSHKKILELNDTYWKNYDEAREDAGIPQGSDFGFIITDSEGKEIVNSLRQPLSRINIEVKETSRMMVHTNGTIVNVRMRIYSY
jgi:hypothetical protein